MSKRYAAVLEQIAISATSFLTVLLGTFLLSSNDMGKLSYAIEFLVLTSILFRTIISQPFFSNNHISNNDGDYNRYFLSASIYTSLIISIFSGSTLFISSKFTSDWTMTYEEFTIFILMFTLSSLFEAYRVVIHSSEGKLRLINQSIILGLARITMIYIISPDKFISFILLMTISYVPAALTVIFWSRRQLSPRLLIRFFQINGSQSFWGIMGLPPLIVQDRLPVLFIGTRFGLSSAGIYFAVRSVMNIANVFLEFIEIRGASQLGKLFHTSAERYRTQIGYLILSFTLAWIIVEICIICLGQIVLIYLPHKWRDGDTLTIVNALWVSVLLIFGWRIAAIHIRNMRRTHYIALSQYVGAGILLLLLNCLANNLGTVAICVAVAAGSTLVAIMCATASAKRSRNDGG